MAGRDAAVFLSHGWSMDDDWPLSDDCAAELVAAHGQSRSMLLAAMRNAGCRRWRELRGRSVGLRVVKDDDA